MREKKVSCLLYLGNGHVDNDGSRAADRRAAREGHPHVDYLAANSEPLSYRRRSGIKDRP